MFKIESAASFRLDEIYQYTLNEWCKNEAEMYVNGLFVVFDKIVNKQVLSHPVPAELNVNGFYVMYKKHFVYWKYLESGEVGIVTILHERMHQMKQFKNPEFNDN
jgi:plasmid stabilization system protein ParE